MTREEIKTRDWDLSGDVDYTHHLIDFDPKCEPLPETLSELMALGGAAMGDLDRDLYVPDSRVWHEGAGAGELCRVNFAGAVMASDLGVHRRAFMYPWYAVEDDREFQWRLRAIEEAREGLIERAVLTLFGYCDVRYEADSEYAFVLDQLRKQETDAQKAVIVKWRGRADEDCLFASWADMDAAMARMSEIECDLRKARW